MLQPAAWREPARALLRQDAVGVLLGVLFCALAIAVVVLFLLRQRRKERTVLWFAMFAFLYGLRMLAGAASVRLLFGVPDAFCFYLQFAITYVIPIPGMLFLPELFPEWRRVLRRLVAVQVVLMSAGILCDQLLHQPESLGFINSLLVLTFVSAFLIAVVRQPQSTPDRRELTIGILVLIATALLNNLSSLRLLPLLFNPDPLGFALFLGVQGHIAAQRLFQNEERLVALDKELDIARRIQSSIMPHEMPRTTRAAIAARYLPMKAVAGDFYDFLAVDENHLGILVADVSGHGVPAALIASMVKVAIAAQAQHAHNPAQVLDGMNRILHGKLHRQFVTAAYLYLDFESGLLRYGAAGHPPLFWVRSRDGAIESLKQNGLVLGMFAKASYSAVECAFEPGDRFVLYSDGLVEAMNAAQEEYGSGRVRGVLAGAAAGSAEQCMTSLVDGLSARAGYAAGRPQDDDLTIIVIDCLAA